MADTKTRHFPEKVAYEGAEFLDVDPRDPHWGMNCQESILEENLHFGEPERAEGL